MRTSALLVCVAATVVGCANQGTRVDVTVRNGSLDATTLGAIHQLVVAVDGAETFATTYDLSDQLVNGGARWVYLAGVDAGELTFSISGLGEGSAVVAVGSSGPVQLRKGKAVDALVALDPASATPDGGVTDGGDAGPVDGSTDDGPSPIDAGGDGPVDFAFPTFLPTVLYPVVGDVPPTAGSKPISVAIGDLDHDGYNDVTFVSDLTTTANMVRAYRTADPHVYTKLMTSFGSYGDIRAVALRDLDGDLKLDVAMTDPTANAVFYVTSGTNNYGTTVQLTTANGATALLLGDVNRDMLFDIIVAEPASNQVVPYLGVGMSMFTQLSPLPAVGNGPSAIAMMDLNNDTYPDLVSTNSGSGTITLMEWNPGTGNFATASVTVGANPTGVALGRLDGDILPDLVVTRSDGTVVVFLNALLAMSPSLTPEPSLMAGIGATSPAIGDLDGDGINDIAVANHDDKTVSMFIGKGNGTFGPAITITVAAAPVSPSPSSPNSIALGDLDGDNRQDLAIAADAGLFLFLTHL